MQTLEENKINYLVFPSSSFTAGTGNDWIIILTPTLTNNELYETFATASVEELNSRWRVMETYITGSTSDTVSRLYAEAGQTYELDLRFGEKPYITWIEAYPKWIETEGTWAQNGINGDTIRNNSVRVSQDRVFISGSVDPTRKLYITSNEDASFVIYQG